MKEKKQFNMNIIVLNPIFEWARWVLHRIRFLKKNKNKKIKIGAYSFVYNSDIGFYNTIYNNVTIIDSMINDFVYVAEGTKITNARIGKFCSFGPNVKIGLGKHPTNFVSTFPAFFSPKMQCQITFANTNHYKEEEIIEIGNDVWVGANALIMDGVNIADGAIIAAGAVVTKNVKPYEIVGGIPAKHIKYRFEAQDIILLLQTCWWNFDIDWIKENYRAFHDINKFKKLLKIE